MPKTGTTRSVLKHLDSIIKDGDPVVLVEQAEELGRVLGKNVSSSGIRNIYSTVKAMPEYKKRELELLRPKLAYLRARSQAIAPLEEVLQEAIQKVEDEESFKRFCEFFEAVVAYHRKYENLKGGGQ